MNYLLVIKELKSISPTVRPKSQMFWDNTIVQSEVALDFLHYDCSVM